MSPEEMAASGAGTDWKVIESRLVFCKQKLDEMGPVIWWPSKIRGDRAAFQSDNSTTPGFSQGALLEVINRNQYNRLAKCSDDV